jgi:hypothetical protein
MATVRMRGHYSPNIEDVSHGELLLRAAAGEREAWNALVERFGEMVWSVARSFRLDDAAASDVAQTVWLRLIENIDKIQDPERLPGWLVTTCRREALRVIKRGARAIPSDFEYDIEDPSPSLESMMIEDEESREGGGCTSRARWRLPSVTDVRGVPGRAGRRMPAQGPPDPVLAA